MLKIPYGISDYKKLKEQNYYYVDKTSYLKALEDVGSVLIYLRPGRFGKTLFTSMMYYYYDVNSEYLFETLFKDTYVYKNPTKNKNNYYTLKFDFSGITSDDKEREELEFSFKNSIITGIRTFIKKYKIDYQIRENYGVSDLVKDFFNQFGTLQLEHKLYIIIDEYDNFTNAILEGNGDRFKKIVGNEGFIKAFYAVIKEYCGLGIVDRVFITGICPITLDSMTTGFNISTDISNDFEFNSMIGLTHEEVKTLINNVAQNKQEEIYKLMVENYDGYLFHYEGKSKVFNATLVMYFMNNYNRFLKIPNELIDSNIAFNYGKVENLLKLQNNDFYLEILEQILKNDEITDNLKIKFNLELDFNRDDIISLLYYFGYLTIKRYDEINQKFVFCIPNHVMNDLYYQYFLKLLNERNIKVDEMGVDVAIREIILEGNIEKISYYIAELLKYYDNRMFRNYDEKYMQVLYYALLFRNTNYKIYNEYPCKNGYIDLMLIRNSDLCKYDIMIELKYIKKKDYKKQVLATKKEEAIKQLNQYSQDERFHLDKLKKYVVIFVGNDLKIIEEV